MASVTMKTADGKSAGTVELDEATFGVQPNVPVMHQVVTAQLAARRAGTQSTKTRSDVRGGGAKPYRQKGTGNARQGSTRSPQFTGGGVALGPKPRSYAQKTPKKMIKLALRSALSDRANDDKILVVDSWGIDTPRTKDAKAALAALEIDGTALIVLGPGDDAAALSFRNLPKVQTILAAELNAYDVLCNDWIVFTKDTVPNGEGDATADPIGDAITEVVEGVAEVVEGVAEAVGGAITEVVEGVAAAVEEVAEGIAEAITADDSGEDASAATESDEEEAAEAPSETDAPAAEGSASDEAGVEPDQTNPETTDSEGETSS